MFRIIIVAIILASTADAQQSTIAQFKRNASPAEVGDGAEPTFLFPVGYEAPSRFPSFAPAVQCTVRMVGSSYWVVESWLIGDEIYKVYQDVNLLANDCTYPVCITDLVFEMQFGAPGILVVQADVEALDTLGSTPDCPYPGYVMGITEDQEYEVPSAGMFYVVVPFPEPVTVDGPFFAGCYFGPETYNLDPMVVTDNDPYLCVSWNDWGQGYVDLVSNPYYNFPGNMVMYTIGYNCGEQGGTAGVTLYSPMDSSLAYGTIELCAAELEDTIAYDRCVFEYFNIYDWIQIAEDPTMDVTFRNGQSPATVNPGFHALWDVSGLAEGYYSVRAVLYRSSNNFTADTISVYVDNTPLTPEMLNPVDGDQVCDSITLSAYVPDEDLSFIQFELRESNDTISVNLPMLNQYRYGDNDGDTLDLNPASQGEFGDYYNGPTILASVTSYFADRGYPELMMSGVAPLSQRGLVEMYADSARVRMNLGSEDDDLIASLEKHIETQGSAMCVEVFSELDLNKILYLTGCRRSLILVGISQPFGHWLALKSLEPLSMGGDEIPCRLYDTRGGLGVETTLRFSSGVEVDYQSAYREVDRFVAIYPRADTSALEVIGGDFNASDGWTYLWDAGGRPEGAYFIAGAGVDLTGNYGVGASWIELRCTGSFLPGDANNSGFVDLDDVVYLVTYIFGAGPEPIPVLESGDSNCSGFVDIDDITYLITYIFGAGPPPADC